MNLHVIPFAGLASLAGAQAAVIAHDSVVPFAQPTPTTTLQTVAVKFKPQIYINNGCHPYPAVNEDGNTSGGLAPTGSQSAGCKGSGYGSQIYGRAVEYEGVYAFMYSWYMPKDETLPGLGHRHDWEACVVWLDSLDSQNIVALSASAHSGYNVYYPPDSSYFDGDSAKIEYSSSYIRTMNLFVLAATAIATLGGADAAVIAHDAVVPFAQPTPNTTIQTVALQFKPQIYINNGCHPYPAVDKDGNTSGGLKPTGSQSAGCKGSGYGSQVYGRAVEYEGVYAFMYSWYMPKDETLDGVGHRHDWENCVVWLDSLDNPSVVALSASYHSSYLYYYPPDSDYLDGDSAKIEYSTSWIVLFVGHFDVWRDAGLEHVGSVDRCSPHSLGGHGLRQCKCSVQGGQLRDKGCEGLLRVE
ncbi:unnamed protein product [Phytophthora lilii]|uniref:Unnamed protein product n=1 Tax=Phytophthora lilii TaxID=2077276 RepID=A0A9W6WK01_9STRA|nr:unnamed protein product [Phytophthora lilii]